MADAKEVGVGDPAEENTFCHRTLDHLTNIISELKHNRVRHGSFSLISIMCQAKTRILRGAPRNFLARTSGSRLAWGNACDFAGHINRRRRCRVFGFFPHHHYCGSAACPSGKHVCEGEQLQSERGKQQRVEPDGSRDQDHGDKIEHLVNYYGANRSQA